MTVRTLIIAIVAVATIGIAAAHAEPGYSTASVNMRTGPIPNSPASALSPRVSPFMSRAAYKTILPGATSAGPTTAAGSSASTSVSTITGRPLSCPTSASRRSASPLWASSPPTIGALVPRPSLVCRARAVGGLQVASARRLACSSPGTTACGLVARGLCSAAWYATASGARLATTRAP